jgi:hypothetical protein
MRMLSLAFTPRFICYTLSILFTTTLLLIILAVPQAIYVAAAPLALFAGLSILGTRDLLQTRHVVLRNYPYLRSSALSLGGHAAGPGASDLPHVHDRGRSDPLARPTFQHKVESWKDEQREERGHDASPRAAARSLRSSHEMNEAA